MECFVPQRVHMPPGSEAEGAGGRRELRCGSQDGRQFSLPCYWSLKTPMLLYLQYLMWLDRQLTETWFHNPSTPLWKHWLICLECIFALTKCIVIWCSGLEIPPYRQRCQGTTRDTISLIPIGTNVCLPVSSIVCHLLAYIAWAQLRRWWSIIYTLIYF